MSARASQARALHGAAWALSLGAFLVLSALKMWPFSFAPAVVTSASPFASTDNYLFSLSSVADASERILEAIAPLPREKAIVLILPDASVRSALIAQNMNYLAWPREVRWLSTEGGQAKRQLLAMSPGALAAIIFWDVEPAAWLPRGIRLGAGQVIVPLRPSA